MIIDTHLHPTNLVDEAWRHTGEPFTGERLLKMMDGPYIINGKPRRIDFPVLPQADPYHEPRDVSAGRKNGPQRRRARE